MKVPTVLLVRRRAAESFKVPKSALVVLENNSCFGLTGVYTFSSGLGGSHPTSAALPAFPPSALLTHPALAAQAERLSFLACQGKGPFPSAPKLEGKNSPESDCFHKLFPTGES